MDVTIERLGLEGEGIARLEGRALFIPGAFPEEHVRASVEPAGRVLRGRLEAVLRPSPARRTAPCPLADRCGGCDWMELSPPAQVLQKEHLLRDALARLGRLSLEEVQLLPTVGTGTDTGTRRRAVLHWESGALGYFGRRSHAPVPVEVCPALVPALAALPGRLLKPLGPLAGSLKAVHLLAEGEAVSLALELSRPVRPQARAVAAALVRAGLAQGVTLLPPDGPAEEVGRPVLEAPAPLQPAARLGIRADGFTQAHATGVDVLVGRALELLGPKPTDGALEFYAGNGTFTFALAAQVRTVLAVESSSLSVSLATSAARVSHVENVRWVQGDAERVGEGLLQEGRRFEVLLVDPPRAGAPRLARVARALGVRSLVYVGCDAGSLARDAGRLVESGFRLRAVQLVDLFPNTHHLEALLHFVS